MAYSQWWKGHCPTLTANTPRYIAFPACFVNTESTLAHDVAIPLGTAGTVSTFRARLSGAPGAGTSYTFALTLAGVADGTLTVTVSDLNVSATATGSLSLSQGAALAIVKTVVGSPASVTVEFDIEFTPTTANYYCYFGFTFHPGGYGVSTFARNLTVMHNYDPSGTSGNYPSFAETCIPHSGTIRAFYGLYREAPRSGIFKGDRTLQLRLNGTLLGTAITYSTNTTGSQTYSTAVVGNDNLCVIEDHDDDAGLGGLVSGPVQNTRLGFCIVIESTTPGQFAWFNNGNPVDTPINTYVGLIGSRGDFTSATEASEQLHSPASLIADVVAFNSRQATGGVRHFLFRVNGVSGTIDCLVADGATGGIDAAHSDTLALGDLIDYKATWTGALASNSAYYMGIAFGPPAEVVIPPGTGGGTTPLMSPFHPANLERFQRQGAYPNPPLERSGARELFSPKRERF